MTNGGNDLEIRVGIDSTSADAGAAAAEADVQRVAASTVAANQKIEGSNNDAAAAAAKYGVSLEIAQAALDRIKAQDKAMEVTALADQMRAASAATDENTGATEANSDAQEDSADRTKALNERMGEHQAWLMRNAFYVHRLAEGFKDLSLGGRAASQGLMDISESLQYMLGPEVAIYAAMAQVAAMLAILVTSHRNRGEAAREAAEAEKDAAKEATDAFAAQVQRYQEGIAAMLQSQGDLLNSQQESTSEIAKQGEMLKTQAGLDKEAALLKLQQGYTTAMGLTDSPDQRETLTRRYRAAQADIEGETTVNVANLEAQDAAQKLRAAKDKLAEQENDLAANTKALADARAQQAQAAMLFAKYGVIEGLNEKGEPTGALQSQAEGITGVPFTGRAASHDVIGDLKESTDDLRLAVASLKEQAQSGPPSMFRTLESPEVRARDWEEAKALPGGTVDQLNQATAQLAAQEAELRDLQKAQEMAAAAKAVLSDKGLQKKVQAGPEEIFQSGIDVHNSQAEADQKARAARQAQQKAQQDTAQRKLEEDQAEALKQAKHDYEVREAERDRDKDAQQKIIDDPHSTPDAAAAAKAVQDRLAAAGAQDQIDHAKALGLSDAEVIKLGGTAGLDTAKSGDVVAAQQKKDEAAALHLQLEALKSQIVELKREIAARPDHAALEPMVRAAEATTNLAQEQHALQSIVNLQVGAILGKVQRLTDDQRQLQSEASDNTAKIKRLESR